MSEMRKGPESGAIQRMRSVVVTTDFQLERGARDDGGCGRSRVHLANSPEDLRDFLPWAKYAA